MAKELQKGGRKILNKKTTWLKNLPQKEKKQKKKKKDERKENKNNNNKIKKNINK